VVKQSSKNLEQDQVVLSPRQMEEAATKLQEEEDGSTLVRELRLASSEKVSRAGLEEDGGHSSHSDSGC